MIASFTQTYGNERDLHYRDVLYEGYARDSRLIEFKNMMDVNFHSFHNCDQRLIDKYKALNKVEKTVYLEHGEVLYTDTIRELLRQLDILEVTHLFFSQDDTFSGEDRTVDLVELLDYVKGFKENFMVNLAVSPKYLNHVELPTDKHRTFTVHHSNTKDYARACKFAMDDSPYIATMDMVKRIYGDYYLNDKRTIWRIEENMADHCASFSIPRYILDKITFKNFNIIGYNLAGKKPDMADLLERGILQVKF